MNTEHPEDTLVTQGGKRISLQRLNLDQLARLDGLLDELGEYGELRLIIEKGRLRFVEVIKSQRL